MADLDSESDLDMTGVGPVLPATRKAPAAAAEAGAETGGVAEGSPPAPSAPSRRAKIGGVNDRRNSSSSSNSSNSKDDRTNRRGNDSLTSLAQEGHLSTVEESGVTLKLRGRGTVRFPLIGRLCRQYGYRLKVT